MATVPLRRIAPALTTVCALHALLLWCAAMHTWRADEGLPNAPVMVTRWIEAARVQPPAIEPEPAIAPRVQRAPRAPRISGSATEAPPLAAPAGPAAPAGTAAATSEPALRTDGVERAVREVTRHPGLAAQSDALIGARAAAPSQGLERGIASAGKADCLGSERGMALGLFALPVAAIDAAAGRCK